MKTPMIDDKYHLHTPHTNTTDHDNFWSLRLRLTPMTRFYLVLTFSAAVVWCTFNTCCCTLAFQFQDRMLSALSTKSPTPPTTPHTTSTDTTCLSQRMAATTTTPAADATDPPPPLYTNVKAVLFDVDGTIADSGQLGFDATLVVLDNNQHPKITYEEYCNGCIYITPDRLARHIGLTPEADGSKFYDVGQQLGQEFDNLYIDLVSIETAAFFPGILQLLNRIPSHIAVGLLTNAAGRYAHGVIKANDVTSDGSLYARFGCILGADDVPKPKPYGDGLQQLCSVLRVNPIDCVYIGDSPTDAMAATAVGMPSIGVTWGAHPAEKLIPHVTHLCSTVEELASMLPQLQKLESDK